MRWLRHWHAVGDGLELQVCGLPGFGVHFDVAITIAFRDLVNLLKASLEVSFSFRSPSLR